MIEVPAVFQAIGYAGGCVYVFDLANRTIRGWLVRRRIARLVAGPGDDPYRAPELRVRGSGGPPPPPPLSVDRNGRIVLPNQHRFDAHCSDCGAPIRLSAYGPTPCPKQEERIESELVP